MTRWRLAHGSDGRCRMNAPSLHVVERVVMACWWRIPPLAASPVDRLGFGGGETVAATNPITEPLIPPPLYRAARRGPTSLILGWASPIRTRVMVGPVVGLARWRSILTGKRHHHQCQELGGCWAVLAMGLAQQLLYIFVFPP